MTSITPPKAPGGGGAAKAPQTNHLKLTIKEYGGRKSTLCAGCGHDAISAALLRALWQSAVDPYKVAKMSGIGCSSKSTAYFLDKSWGFNSVHGRMPSVATGALLANRSLLGVGISGDGDTASIGMGQFVHVVRRNMPLLYVVENNGVYGLTKGQFSATADRGSMSKYKDVNEFEAIDLCGLALELGCSFVARSFSADRKQLIPIFEAALNHNGTAVVDVISPCVTFNNHAGSTKSYDWGKENEKPLHEIGFVNPWDQDEVEYDPGTTMNVEMPDGGSIRLSKLADDHDPRDRAAARAALTRAKESGEFLTGIFYVDPDAPSFHDGQKMTQTPIVDFGRDRLRPGPEVLDEIMASFR